MKLNGIIGHFRNYVGIRVIVRHKVFIVQYSNIHIKLHRALCPKQKLHPRQKYFDIGYMKGRPT